MLDYVRPANPIAAAIVVALVALAAGWALRLAQSWFRLRHASGIADRLIALTASLRPVVGDSEGTSAAYHRTLAGEELDAEHPIARHVEVIVVAGAGEARLDVGELLRHTEAELVGSDIPRRYVLGVFLIFGLLGTLFGLADTIAALVPRDSGDVYVRTNLSAVLRGLRTAFAPSICGVFLSIAATLGFAIYQRRAVQPLLQKLRGATVATWVPALYPTPSQRLLETTSQSLAAANKVAQFAAEVREDTGRLRSAIRGSVQATDGFRERIGQVTGLLDAADRTLKQNLAALAEKVTTFSEELTDWTKANGEVRRLYAELVQQQRRQSEYMEGSQALAAELHKEIQTLHQAHTAALTELNATAADWGTKLDAQLRRQTEDMSKRFENFDVTLRSLRGPFQEAAERLVNVAVGMKQLSDDLLREVTARAAASPPVSRPVVSLDGTERLLANILGELKARQTSGWWRRLVPTKRRAS